MPITDVVQTVGIVGAVLILLVWVVSQTPTPWKKHNNNPGRLSGLSELAREIAELRETLSRKIDTLLTNQTEELRLLERMDGRLSSHSGGGSGNGDGGDNNSD